MILSSISQVHFNIHFRKGSKDNSILMVYSTVYTYEMVVFAASLQVYVHVGRG